MWSFSAGVDALLQTACPKQSSGTIAYDTLVVEKETEDTAAAAAAAQAAPPAQAEGGASSPSSAGGDRDGLLGPDGTTKQR